MGRVDKSDVRKYIRFNSAVRDVTYSNETGKFTVIAQQEVAAGLVEPVDPDALPEEQEAEEE